MYTLRDAVEHNNPAIMQVLSDEARVSQRRKPATRSEPVWLYLLEPDNVETTADLAPEEVEAVLAKASAEASDEDPAQLKAWSCIEVALVKARRLKSGIWGKRKLYSMTKAPSSYLQHHADSA